MVGALAWSHWPAAPPTERGGSDRRRRRDRGGGRVVRPGALRQAGRAARASSPRGPADQPYLQYIDPRRWSTPPVRERRGQEGLLRQRLDLQPVAPDRLDHHEPAAPGAAGPGRHLRDGDPRRPGLRQHADRRHRLLHRRGQLRRVRHLAELDRGDDPGRRARVRDGQAGRRVRPRRGDRLRHHVHPPDRRLRLGHRHRRVPHRQPRGGRQGRGAADPAGRRRARAALGRGREALRRGRHRGRGLLHRRRPDRDQEDHLRRARQGRRAGRLDGRR